MKNSWEAKNVVDLVDISKDRMWGLSQGLSYYFTDKMNDYAKRDNTWFSKFSETYQEILGNQDEYSWSDAKKVVETPILHREMGCHCICV